MFTRRHMLKSLQCVSQGHKWEDRVGCQDCMQSRQDYILAVEEKRRDTDREEDSPGGAARRTELCRITFLTRQYVGDVCRVSRTYEEGFFGLVAWQEVR